MDSVKIAAICSFLAVVWPAGAQEIGDPGRGFTYAQRQCSDCHAAAGERLAGIATFEEIANTRGMTRMALTVWFQTPHPNMPNLILDRRDREDVVAYILSLRDGK